MTLDQALADIERLRQEMTDLYESRDQDGRYRQLLPCELEFIRQHREITIEFTDHIKRALYLHGGSDDYRMVREVSLKRQAVKIQQAFDTMKRLREDERT